MPPRNQLTAATPYAVEAALKKLGGNIRTARLRRNLSLAEVAAKVGVERHAVADAERGKSGTGVGIYVGILWALNLLPMLDRVADPTSDEEGLAFAGHDERERARKSGGPSNAF
jgi:transcriptional regulator with XRE-family HTH domain